MRRKYRVLMCCSDLEYKGGMVSVVKGYLDYPGWSRDIEITFVPTHRQAGKAGLITYFARAAARIGWMAMRGKIDVAHLHVAERGSFLRKGFLVRMLHRFNIPVILHHHGAEFDDYYKTASESKKKYIRDILTEADINLALTEGLVEMISSKAPDARVQVLHNAVQVPPADPYNPDRKGILFLGRLGQRKGTYVLLDAIKELEPRLPEFIKFYLCGDGEVEEVKARARELGIDHRIAHIGWTDGILKEKIIDDTMINVLPSFHEGLPMTIIETMSRGIPNISTPVSSIPEVIDGSVTGLLVPPGDSHALAEAIMKLVGDRNLRISMSVAAHGLMLAGYAIEGRIRKLEGFYRQLGK